MTPPTQVDRELVLKMATVLKQLESYNEQVQVSNTTPTDRQLQQNESLGGGGVRGAVAEPTRIMWDDKMVRC